MASESAQLALLLFTDLDGTLLGHQDYAYDAAIPVLAQLKTLQIPVIPVTSKTRAEVAQLRAEVGLTDPFVVENGGGVFIPESDRNFPNASGTVQDGYHIHQLGLTYPQARQLLRQVETALETRLLGFGDMTIAQVQQYTGLSAEAAAQAQRRDFSEPFVTPQQISGDRIRHVVEQLGYQVVVGDRFSHLIGVRSGKGRAVQTLIALYQQAHPTAQILTIGLGNSPNDLAMLEVVDLPIILPGASGPHPGLQSRGWQVAPMPAPEGWAAIVEEILWVRESI
ncbi:MAG: HAD-IIB family hydrolase [Spirulina sp. SIO3F2]|nr:HAD-IIB family hydrolase [Spirulina sp. SIO3F2]